MQHLYKVLLVFSLLLSSTVWSENKQDIMGHPEELNAIVYRTPTCGCCGKWVKYLERNQFKVQDVITDEVDDLKKQLGIKKSLASCHTAIINGYVVEGHVPVSDILNMLNEKPEIVGITVPGMVVGTPGMEMGDKVNPYKVLSYDDKGSVTLFNQYE